MSRKKKLRTNIRDTSKHESDSNGKLRGTDRVSIERFENWWNSFELRNVPLRARLRRNEYHESKIIVFFNFLFLLVFLEHAR